MEGPERVWKKMSSVWNPYRMSSGPKRDQEPSPDEMTLSRSHLSREDFEVGEISFTQLL